MALDDMCSPRIGIRKWTGWDKEKKITLRHVSMMWRRRYNNTALDHYIRTLHEGYPSIQITTLSHFITRALCPVFRLPMHLVSA